MSANRNNNPDVGDQPILWVDVTDDSNVPMDPTAGRLLVQAPSAAVATIVPFNQLVVAPEGVTGRVEWTMDAPIGEGGRWNFYWEFTSGVVAGEPYSFTADGRTVTAPAI